LVARHRPLLRPREGAIPPPRYVTRSTANYHRLVIGDQFDGVPAGTEIEQSRKKHTVE